MIIGASTAATRTATLASHAARPSIAKLGRQRCRQAERLLVRLKPGRHRRPSTRAPMIDDGTVLARRRAREGDTTHAPESDCHADCSLPCSCRRPDAACRRRPRPPPPPRWERKAELSLVSTGGNTDTQTLGLGASVIFRPGKWTTEARTAFVQSETDDIQTAKSLTADVRESACPHDARRGVRTLRLPRRRVRRHRQSDPRSTAASASRPCSVRCTRCAWTPASGTRTRAGWPERTCPSRSPISARATNGRSRRPRTSPTRRFSPPRSTTGMRGGSGTRSRSRPC